MRASGKRLLFVLVSSLLAGFVAAAGGYYLARRITVHEAEKQLSAYAGRLVADSEASASELRTVLTAMNVSVMRPCSASDLNLIRQLSFESDYVRDAGRMRNGKALCSAGQGRITQAQQAQKPTFILQDGSELYTSFPLYKNGEMLLNYGGAFVSFTPMTRQHLEPPPMHFQETTMDSPRQTAGYLQGETDTIAPSILRTEGVAQVGENVYATACSIRFSNCVTAFTSIAELAANNRTRFFGCIALCCVLGVFFGLALSLAYRRQTSLAQQLRRAIAKDKLSVVYQPIVNMRTRRIVGAESLTRWTNEDGAAVSPDVFIKLAEEGGFIGELTRLVVRHVLEDHAPLLRQAPSFRISVNVSAADLSDPLFLSFLEESLQAVKVAPQSLSIEVTESATAREAAAKQTLAQLCARGHHVNIDDFGTGYSNLSYLHDLSVNAIKIDKSLTMAIGAGSVMVSIFPQILAMAKALGLGVIVEGVETEEQADYFNAQEEEILGQGWLFGRPMPAEQFLRLLVESRRAGNAPAPVEPVYAPEELLPVAILAPMPFLSAPPEDTSFDRSVS
jgi:sensor c-di-GMP phosphodiesterase-like protein